MLDICIAFVDFGHGLDRHLVTHRSTVLLSSAMLRQVHVQVAQLRVLDDVWHRLRLSPFSQLQLEVWLEPLVRMTFTLDQLRQHRLLFNFVTFGTVLNYFS